MLRSAALWKLALLTIGLNAVLIGVSPLGISADNSQHEFILETSLLGALAGCSLALVHLARLRPLLARISPARRLRLEIGAIAASSTVSTLAAVAPHSLASARQVPFLELTFLLAHIASIGLLIAPLQLRPIIVGIGMPLIVWATQTLCGPNDPRVLVRFLRTALDPTQFSKIADYIGPVSTPLVIGFAPIIALLGLRAALDSLNANKL